MTQTQKPQKIERRVDPTPAEEKEALDRISRGRTTVAAFTPFFGHLVLKMTPVIARAMHKVDTAAIAPDGTLYINHLFLKELDDAEVAGLLVHEVLHPALLCWKRQGSRRARLTGPGGITFSLWNLAHDLSFNPDIVDLSQRCNAKGKVKLPPDGALDMRFKDQSCEQIYDAILKEAKKNKKQKEADGQSDGGCDPGGLDGVLVKVPGVGKQGRPAKDGGAYGIGDDLRSDLSKTETGKRAARGDQGAQERMEREWQVTVIAAAIAHERQKGKGSLPGNLQKVVEEYGENKVDWRDVLSQLLGEYGDMRDVSYRRPSRRSESAGAYLAGFDRYGYDDVVILWDTSGSMNGREQDILGEFINGICEDLSLPVRVICCDTQVTCDVRDVEEACAIIPHIKGGGGSDFRPAFKMLAEEGFSGVVVVFTDGMIDVPTDKPQHLREVIWCLEPGSGDRSGWGDRDPTNGRWGQVVWMED